MGWAGLFTAGPQWETVFGPIDSCKRFVLSQDEVDEEKERDTKEVEERNGDMKQSESTVADKEAENRRRAKEEEANADSGDKKDLDTEKAMAEKSPEKSKQSIQPWVTIEMESGEKLGEY